MSFLLNGIPTDHVIDRFVELSFEVSERIIRLLTQKGMTQRDLAIRLGKKDSEISKWLQGNHNLTLRTIATIEIALGENFIKVEGLDNEYTLPSQQVGIAFNRTPNDWDKSKEIGSLTDKENIFIETSGFSKYKLSGNAA